MSESQHQCQSAHGMWESAVPLIAGNIAVTGTAMQGNIWLEQKTGERRYDTIPILKILFREILS